MSDVDPATGLIRCHRCCQYRPKKAFQKRVSTSAGNVHDNEKPPLLMKSCIVCRDKGAASMKIKRQEARLRLSPPVMLSSTPQQQPSQLVASTHMNDPSFPSYNKRITPTKTSFASFLQYVRSTNNNPKGVYFQKVIIDIDIPKFNMKTKNDTTTGTDNFPLEQQVPDDNFDYGYSSLDNNRVNEAWVSHQGNGQQPESILPTSNDSPIKPFSKGTDREEHGEPGRRIVVGLDTSFETDSNGPSSLPNYPILTQKTFDGSEVELYAKFNRRFVPILRAPNGQLILKPDLSRYIQEPRTHHWSHSSTLQSNSDKGQYSESIDLSDGIDDRENRVSEDFDVGSIAPETAHEYWKRHRNLFMTKFVGPIMNASEYRFSQKRCTVRDKNVSIYFQCFQRVNPYSRAGKSGSNPSKPDTNKRKRVNQYNTEECGSGIMISFNLLERQMTVTFDHRGHEINYPGYKPKERVAVSVEPVRPTKREKQARKSGRTRRKSTQTPVLSSGAFTDFFTSTL